MKDNIICKYNPNFMENIAKNVRKYRKQFNYTQQYLANLIGVSGDFIRKFENSHGKRGISLKCLYKISIVFNVQINDFFK